MEPVVTLVPDRNPGTVSHQANLHLVAREWCLGPECHQGTWHRLARLRWPDPGCNHSPDAVHAIDHGPDVGFVAPGKRGEVGREVPLDRGDDPADLLLANLHRAPDQWIRAALARNRIDQVWPAQQKPGRGRATQTLASGEDRKVHP